MRADEKTRIWAGDKGSLVGVPTGFEDFDDMTGGLRGADLVLLAGRPGTGKTTLAIDISLRAFLLFDTPVCYFSMKLNKENLCRRLLGVMAGIEADRLENGDLDRVDWLRLGRVAGQLSKSPLFVDDTTGLTVTDMRDRAAGLKEEHGLGLVVVDYLQLIPATGRHTETLGQPQAETVACLKTMARDLDLPVIVLSQLSRAKGEKRPNQRPVLTDLPGRDLERPADIIGLLHRKPWDEKDGVEPGGGLTELIIAKNRNGPTGFFFGVFPSAKSGFSFRVMGHRGRDAGGSGPAFQAVNP